MASDVLVSSQKRHSFTNEPLFLTLQAELKQERPASVVRLLELIIEGALYFESSDIHLNPTATGLQVRFRIDGRLHDYVVLPTKFQTELIARLKILTGLRTDEHFAAQDGRFRFTRSDSTVVDIRVSVVPLYYGENAVLRLLTQKNEKFTFTKLGFTSVQQKILAKALLSPHGLILATGPTGSGKTTTLYSLLQQLDAEATAIVTIEDPIEYAMPGINQIQVQARTGLTFANGLRSMLRQDPDTIMVGEIRDNETAGLAINIALTGHLVVSTLHTNDVVTTIPRLIDMRIEPYLIASTVRLLISQRLVRCLCLQCRRANHITPLVAKQIVEISKGLSALKAGNVVYEMGGCERCHGTGYSGRVGVYEILALTPRLREAILARISTQQLQNLAVEAGMVPLIVDGLEKVQQGITSLDEIFKLNHE